jgi:hypothetical protein
MLFIVVKLNKIKGRDGLGMWREWGRRNTYRVLLGKPEGKRPLGRPSCQWESIKIDFKETA